MTFNTNQPRNPAGSSGGGEWASGPSGSAISYPKPFDNPPPSNDYLRGLHQSTGDLSKSERNALQEFTSTSYSDFREWDLKGTHAAEVETLYSAMDKLPEYHGVIYRGLSDLTPEETAKLLNSPEMEFDTVSSFSRNASIGYNFSNITSGRGVSGQSAILKLQTHSARNVEHLSSKSGEREVLVGKGSKYKITKAYYVKFGPNPKKTHLIVEGEEI